MNYWMSLSAPEVLRQLKVARFDSLSTEELSDIVSRVADILSEYNRIIVEVKESYRAIINVPGTPVTEESFSVWVAGKEKIKTSKILDFRGFMFDIKPEYYGEYMGWLETGELGEFGERFDAPFEGYAWDQQHRIAADKGVVWAAASGDYESDHDFRDTAGAILLPDNTYDEVWYTYRRVYRGVVHLVISKREFEGSELLSFLRYVGW